MNLSPEEVAEQIRLLTTYRRTLAAYLEQQAALGRAYSPPGVIHGINEARSQILRIKTILRAAGVDIPNDPDDDDPPQSIFAPGGRGTSGQGRWWPTVLGIALGMLLLAGIGFAISRFWPGFEGVAGQPTAAPILPAPTRESNLPAATVPASPTHAVNPPAPTAAPPTLAHAPEPEQAVRTFYQHIGDRLFEAAWAMMTRRWKDDPDRGPRNGPYSDPKENYALSWSSVDQVAVESVATQHQNGADAEVRARLRFAKTTGTEARVDLLLGLIFDSGRNAWLIDRIRPADIPSGECRVTVYGLYLHGTPDFSQPLQLMPTGTALAPIARLQGSNWLRVRLLDDGAVGLATYDERWIACNGVLSSLPEEGG